MIRDAIIKQKFGPKSVRWRLHSATRMESFTDSVFAFAVTLLVVSLEVPETFRELVINMKGLFGFAICFAMIMLIWFEQYSYFRKYGLQDTKTILLNSILLFVVLFYVYPLKFLFSFLTQGNKITHADGSVAARFEFDYQMGQLMIIYAIGFIVIYLTFFVMHQHALKKKDDLFLNPLEVYNTKTAMYGNLCMAFIGMLSLLFSVLSLVMGGIFSFFAGMSYALIGVVLGLFYTHRAKQIKKKFTESEIKEISEQSVTVQITSVPQLKS